MERVSEAKIRVIEGSRGWVNFLVRMKTGLTNLQNLKVATFSPRESGYPHNAMLDLVLSIISRDIKRPEATSGRGGRVSWH